MGGGSADVEKVMRYANCRHHIGEMTAPAAPARVGMGGPVMMAG
jgi:hypothetical protein